MALLRIIIDNMETVIDTSTLKTFRETAKALDKTYPTLYRWIKAGQLMTVNIGGRTFVPQAEIDRILKNDTNLTQAMNKGEV
jgi:phage antirepressor YoqD-like protein